MHCGMQWAGLKWYWGTCSRNKPLTGDHSFFQERFEPCELFSHHAQLAKEKWTTKKAGKEACGTQTRERKRKIEGDLRSRPDIIKQIIYYSLNQKRSNWNFSRYFYFRYWVEKIQPSRSGNHKFYRTTLRLSLQAKLKSWDMPLFHIIAFSLFPEPNMEFGAQKFQKVEGAGAPLFLFILLTLQWKFACYRKGFEKHRKLKNPAWKFQAEDST